MESPDRTFDIHTTQSNQHPAITSLHPATCIRSPTSDTFLPSSFNDIFFCAALLLFSLPSMPPRVSFLPVGSYRPVASRIGIAPSRSHDLVIRSRIQSSNSFSTALPNMAPPKAALDFIDFVNDSPTRMLLLFASLSYGVGMFDEVVQRSGDITAPSSNGWPRFVIVR